MHGERNAITATTARPKGLSLADIADDVEALWRSGCTHGATWTLGELCEHLAKSIESTVDGCSAEAVPQRWARLGSAKKIQRWLIKWAMLITGWFPSSVQAPAKVMPADGAHYAEAMARLRQAIRRFDRKFADPEATWGYHSILGRMRGRMWVRFHRVHTAHHLALLRRRAAGRQKKTSV